jgi:hypothetical protein
MPQYKHQCIYLISAAINKMITHSFCMHTFALWVCLAFLNRPDKDIKNIQYNLIYYKLNSI